MKKTCFILPISFVLCPTFGNGQDRTIEECEIVPEGLKSLSFIVEKGAFGWQEIEKNYYTEDGLKFKTEFIFDSLLVKIDTFIYTSENRLIRRETLDPIFHRPYQVSEFLYDKNGSNFRTMNTSFTLVWIDSVSVDTIFLHTRYDFVRDEKERFTERKTFYCTEKAPVFDTTTFDITFHHWINDSVVVVEDHYANTIDYRKQYYQQRRLIKTEFRDAKNWVIDSYDYEYAEFDENGFWSVCKIFQNSDKQRTIVNTHRQEIEMY